MRGPKSNWGQPIAYHPLLAKFFGSVNAGIFFGQLAYWEPRAGANRSLGVYKSAQQWTDETGLSYREQATARRILTDGGYMVETNKRLEHRLYFRIVWDNFNEEFGAWVQERGGAFAPDFPNDENAFGELQDPASGAPEAHSPNDENAIRGVLKRRSSIDTETTAETTAERGAAADAPAATKPRKRASKAELPRPDGVAEQVWADFSEQRKKKRAPLTATALEDLEREASKAGLTLEQAMRMCCAQGWTSLRASWESVQAEARKTRGAVVAPRSGEDTTLEAMRKYGIGGGDCIDMED